jgi:hypothetical protein
MAVVESRGQNRIPAADPPPGELCEFPLGMGLGKIRRNLAARSEDFAIIEGKPPPASGNLIQGDSQWWGWNA